MQHIDDIFRDTQSLIQPHPVEPFERQAAGDDDMPLAMEAWTIRDLLTCIACSLLIWAAGFELLKLLTPFIVWLVE